MIFILLKVYPIQGSGATQSRGYFMYGRSKCRFYVGYITVDPRLEEVMIVIIGEASPR